MTRKRFQKLVRAWMFEMDQFTKSCGRKPLKKTRNDLRVVKSDGKCSYLNAWKVIRESTLTFSVGLANLPEK